MFGQLGVLGADFGRLGSGGGAGADPLAPGEPTIDLIAASDTGTSSTDNITSDTTPDIDFNTATPVLEGDILRLRDNGVTIATHTVTAGEVGSSTIALGLSALSQGSHSLQGQHERYGHVSAWGTALAITVDTTAPTISTNAAQSTQENTPFEVTLAADETVTWTKTSGADQALFSLVGATLTLSAKNFEAPADADANNTYVVQVTATDPAGNATNKTITVTVTDEVEAATSREWMGGDWLIPAFMVNTDTGNRQWMAGGTYNVES